MCSSRRTRGDGLATRPVRLRGPEGVRYRRGRDRRPRPRRRHRGHQARGGPGRPRGRGGAPGPGRHPRPGGRRGHVRGRWPALVAEVLDDGADPVVCGVGHRRADDRGRGHGVADQHPRLAGLPAARPAGRAHRGAHLRRQRRQGAGPGRGLGGRGAGAATTTSPWSCPPGSAAASCSTAGCSTAPTATPATSATSSWCPTATCAAAAPGAAWRPRRRAPPSPPSPVARPPRPAPRSSSRTGTLVGRAVASVANLLDLRLAVVAGSVALGFGDAVLRRRPGRGRPLGPPRLLDRHGDPPRAARRRRARSSARRRWAGGAWAWPSGGEAPGRR